MINVVLSQLDHTWLIDLDGTLFKHNSHKNGGDELLPGVKDFWSQIPKDDVIVLITARAETERASTLETLKQHGLRFDHVMFGLPTGERVLINDAKPLGLLTALAVNLKRDAGLVELNLLLDKNL